jgi:hypothetical protein
MVVWDSGELRAINSGGKCFRVVAGFEWAVSAGSDAFFEIRERSSVLTRPRSLMDESGFFVQVRHGLSVRETLYCCPLRGPQLTQNIGIFPQRLV